MTLHIKKLCVGADRLEDLEAWRDHVVSADRRAGGPGVMTHVTRMFPRRSNELLDGGSLYWVIKGAIRARQAICDLQERVGDDGVARCAIILEPDIISTELRPCRPFQGWRYLKPDAAPRDAGLRATADLPAALREELSTLGLL